MNHHPLRTLVFFVFVFALVPVYSQSDLEIVFNKGVTALQGELYGEAEKYFSEVIDLGIEGEGRKMAYIYQGFALNGQERYAGAIMSFTTAIAIDPLDARTFIDRGLAHARNDDILSASSDFKQAIVLDKSGPSGAAAYAHLASLNSTSGNYAEAITYLDEYLKLAPDDSDGFFRRGYAKGMLMDIDGSILDYDKAIQIRPDFREAFANRGVQKVNRIPVTERKAVDGPCLKEPCVDLLKAKALGDDSVEDMIFLYCKKCR